MDDVMESVKDLHRSIMRKSKELNPDSYGRGHGKLLSLIMENEGIMLRHLALALDVRPPTLTDKLDRLEMDGNIKRKRNKNDMRIIHVFITDKGKEALEKRAEEKNTLNKDMLEVFTAEEIATFCSLCDRLKENINKSNSDRGGSGKNKQSKQNNQNKQDKNIERIS